MVNPVRLDNPDLLDSRVQQDRRDPRDHRATPDNLDRLTYRPSVVTRDLLERLDPAVS